MRSVSSTPRCPSASSPARPGAERATSKVSCTCVGHVSTCPRVHLPRAGERDDTCERYSSVPECFKPCPAKCEQSFRDQVTTTTCTCTWCTCPHATLLQVENPQCERFASSPAVPSCYYTPCSQECMDQAQDNKCPRQVAWSHPHTPTTDITTSHLSCFQCQKFKGNRACCGEECPAPCMEAAARGECLPECKQYAGNPKCCRCVTDDDVCS